MADFTKILKSFVAPGPHKHSKLRPAVGLPFWAGLIGSFLIALYALHGLIMPVGGMLASISGCLLAGVFGGLLIQAFFDLFIAMRSGEVQKKYVFTLVAVIFLAFIYGIIYYRAPDAGFEKTLSIASLVVTSALFGYVVGRAKGR